MHRLRQMQPIILARMNKKVKYRFCYEPEDGWVGDVIPCSDGEELFLYYLKEKRIDGIPANRTTWNLLTGTSPVELKEYGIALPTGGEQDVDRSCYTGSIVYAGDGIWHMYYTAQNSADPRYWKNGRPIQCITHAESIDRKRWKKDPKFLLRAPEGFNPCEWRDPYVYRSREEEIWRMLVSARPIYGLLRRAGCIYSLRSTDLKSWEWEGVFYAPNTYEMLECPECFQMGDRWYLIFSTFSEKYVTHYRIGQSPTGPWKIPGNDTFDGRAFYAGKTAELQGKRMLFGWIPTRNENSDFGKWKWAGSLGVHELYQEEDGTLSVRMPEAIGAECKKTMSVMRKSMIGRYLWSKDNLQIQAEDQYSEIFFEKLPHCGLVQGKLSFSENTRAFGIHLHADTSLARGYFYRMEPQYQRVVFDQWPRSQWEEPVIPNYFENDRPFDAGLERPVQLKAGIPVELELFIDGDICILYLDKKVALTARCSHYDRPLFGIFAEGGSVTVMNLKCQTVDQKEKEN